MKTFTKERTERIVRMLQKRFRYKEGLQQVTDEVCIVEQLNGKTISEAIEVFEGLKEKYPAEATLDIRADTQGWDDCDAVVDLTWRRAESLWAFATRLREKREKADHILNKEREEKDAARKVLLRKRAEIDAQLNGL